MPITDINGNPYTSATEDIRLMEFKKKFRDVLAKQLNYAMTTSTNGTIQIHMEPLEDIIDQAYYMGREDAS